MPRPHPQPHGAARRRPSLAGTLTAAVLVGELAVVSLVGADAAHAQADEPGAADVVPEPSPDDVPHDVPSEEPTDVPVDVPDRPDVPEVAPDVPALPPAGAGVPVRTGHDAVVAPMVVPRTARADDPDESDHETEVASPRAPVRDAPVPSPAPPERWTKILTDGRRARRGAPSRPATGTSAAAGALPATHTIAPGEHLWGIAAARVARVTGRDAATLPAEEIVPYWTRLCMTNETRLRSGIPSLVYPGEVIELPPT
jgi:hypothetical protein